MNFTKQIAADLTSVIVEWRDKFLALDSKHVSEKPAQDRWSVKEVVGHLIDSACNNHQRFIRVQDLDELSFPKYDQNHWVDAANYQEMEWNSVVLLWFHYNELIASIIRNIREEDLPKPCTITPYPTCTFEFLVKDYLDHLNHHLEVLEKRIAEKETH